MLNEGGGGGVCGYDEIWPGLHANATSYGIAVSDPMLTDQRSNRRKRHEEEDDLCARGAAAASTSSSYNNNNNALDGKRLQAVESNNNKVEKTDEPSKQDYIHVRARRGQATDGHSLAERARREKIGERMKTLQDIVPGCNKVIGRCIFFKSEFCSAIF